MAVFSLRIVETDYYLVKPLDSFDKCYSDFRQDQINKVPVIRIFGSTPKGQRACLHIHGVLPYFYVPLPTDVTNPSTFAKQFALSLDVAIQIGSGRAVSRQQMYVSLVEVVKRKPLYGYYAEDLDFLKVYLLNPRLIKQCSEILINGSVLNQVFQPFETHIPYILQFLIDYNLYGMNLIHLKHVWFRLPLPESESLEKIGTPLGSPLHSPNSPNFSQTNNNHFSKGNVPDSMIMSGDICKQTRCILEADAVGIDILNQLYIKDSVSVNPGLHGIWEEEKQRRRINLQSSMIEVPQSQPRPEYNPTEDEQGQLQILKAAVSDRLNRMDLSIPMSLSDVDESLSNKTLEILSSSMDRDLVNLLVDLDTDGSGSNTNTPLLEATFINNGISDDENNTEDDEEAESLSMTQKVDYDGEDPCPVGEELLGSLCGSLEANAGPSSDQTNQIPQLDGHHNHPIDEDLSGSSCLWNGKSKFATVGYECSIQEIGPNGTKFVDEHHVYLPCKPNPKYKPSNLTCTRGEHVERPCIIPQLDGKSDEIESDSDQDFKMDCSRKKKSIKGKKCSLSIVFSSSDKSKSKSLKESVGQCCQTNTKECNKKQKQRNKGHTMKNRKDSSKTCAGSKRIEIGECVCGDDDKIVRRRKRKKTTTTCDKDVIDYSTKYNLRSCKVVISDIRKEKEMKLNSEVGDVKSSENNIATAKDETDSLCFGEGNNTDNGEGNSIVVQNVDMIHESEFSAVDGDAGSILKLREGDKLSDKDKDDDNLENTASVDDTYYLELADQIDIAKMLGSAEQCADSISEEPFCYHDTLYSLSFPSPKKINFDGQLPVFSQPFLMETGNDLALSPRICHKPTNKKQGTEVNRLETADVCQDVTSYSQLGCIQSLPLLNSEKHDTIQDDDKMEEGSFSTECDETLTGVDHDQTFVISTNTSADNNPMCKTNEEETGTASIKSTHVSQLFKHRQFPEFSCSQKSMHSDEILDIDKPRRTLKVFTPVLKPPTRACVVQSLFHLNLNEVNHVQPFYSNEIDVGSKVGVYHRQQMANLHDKVSTLPNAVLSTESDGAIEDFKVKQLSSFDCLAIDIDNLSTFDCITPASMHGEKNITLTPCKLPPQISEVSMWLSNATLNKRSPEVVQEKPCIEKGVSDLPRLKDQHDLNAKNIFSAIPPSLKSSNDSEIEGVSLNNTYGFDVTHNNLCESKVLHENQHLTVVSIELHMTTRRTYKPDPTMDPICAIFYYVCRDLTNVDNKKSTETGMFVIGLDPSDESDSNIDPTRSHQELKKILCLRGGLTSCIIHTHASEVDLIQKFASFIQEIDPDIIIGYEVQMSSWGYLIERAATLNINICQMLSRVIDQESELRVNDNEPNEFNFGMLVNMAIKGRIVLNVWRIMRSEVTLQTYSFENVFYHVLHQRIPCYSLADLTQWWGHDYSRWKVCSYYIVRCTGNLKLLTEIDFINRTSELARLFGISFYSVISRGSQFRVESMMLRIAKPLNFVPISPSVHQRASMAAPECIPLVIEPISCFYVDPVIVLDFQSLYPSIIIAYNYCYSTCLGKAELFSQNEYYKFGTSHLNLPLSVLKKLMASDIHISPNGVGFVKSNIVKGILPMMLEEILNTRIMVKGSMKQVKDDKILYKMLDSTQLGLKLIANVTYGYTSANFSGRMPCIEIGDSVVRKGRETLERAIQLVESTKRWNAKVVYGDTDSLFILLKGASKERAFSIGKEIVDEVTATNPKPVKLKFEKVYLPCVLVTKKRYVGYMYESLSQTEPVFDAKGIETVRRDNCPAVGKILEKSIRLLFETKDVSLVKCFVQKQFTKIMEEKVILKDFIFAKEYHGASNYKAGACVPALTLSRKMIKNDRRSEPRVGQRVPYVIVYGSPGLPLIQLVRTPMEVINNNSLRLNGVYYITKQICPALSRIFSLLGVNVIKWFTDLPKTFRTHKDVSQKPGNSKGMISQYFSSDHCVVCGLLTNSHLCPTCRKSRQDTAVILNSSIRASERRLTNLSLICKHCSGTQDESNTCVSLDCPVFYKLTKLCKNQSEHNLLRKLLSEL